MESLARRDAVQSTDDLHRQVQDVQVRHSVVPAIVRRDHTEVSIVLIHRELVQHVSRNYSTCFIIDRRVCYADPVDRCFAATIPNRLRQEDVGR